MHIYSLCVWYVCVCVCVCVCVFETFVVKYNMSSCHESAYV